MKTAPTEDARVDPDTGAAPAVPPVIKPILRGSGRARIVTPYRADVFERRLRALNLLGKHSQLPAHIRGGFPMGKFSPIEKTYVPNNYAKRREHFAFIKEYVREEVSLRRMEGPYDEKRVKSILKSDFITSPLFVKDKAGSPGKFRLVRNFSHKNEDGVSVNNAIDLDDYPTEWGNAHSVAQIVGVVAIPHSSLLLVSLRLAACEFPVNSESLTSLVCRCCCLDYLLNHLHRSPPHPRGHRLRRSI